MVERPNDYVAPRAIKVPTPPVAFAPSVKSNSVAWTKSSPSEIRRINMEKRQLAINEADRVKALAEAEAVAARREEAMRIAYDTVYENTYVNTLFSMLPIST